MKDRREMHERRHPVGDRIFGLVRALSIGYLTYEVGRRTTITPLSATYLFGMVLFASEGLADVITGEQHYVLQRMFKGLKRNQNAS